MKVQKVFIVIGTMTKCGDNRVLRSKVFGVYDSKELAMEECESISSTYDSEIDAYFTKDKYDDEYEWMLYTVPYFVNSEIKEPH